MNHQLQLLVTPTIQTETFSRFLVGAWLVLVGWVGVLLQKAIAKWGIDASYRVETRVFLVMGVVSVVLSLCSENNVKCFVGGVRSLFAPVPLPLCGADAW